MTSAVRDLERRIHSASELLSVTRSMRGIAAVNLRRNEMAVQAIGGYETVIENGLHIALRDGAIKRLPVERPTTDTRTAMIVFGSNQGLCGSVNRRVADRAVGEMQGLSSVVHVGAIGARLAAELELAGVIADTNWDLPSTSDGITGQAEQVLARATRWRTDEAIVRILLVFPRFLGRNRHPDPVMLQLTPADRDWLEWLAIRLWPSKTLPMFNLPRLELVDGLLRQALFVRLHRSFAQTMASVSSSRLAAMDSAQRNVEDRLAALRNQQQHQRHAQITEELLDVVSGYEALGADRRSDSS